MWLFFFSSRRRHTRFDCDWSSDVCSSDLVPGGRWLRPARARPRPRAGGDHRGAEQDRKSTRLNSSHSQISYAVFCLKKKKPSMKTARWYIVGKNTVTGAVVNDYRPVEKHR